VAAIAGRRIQCGQHRPSTRRRPGGLADPALASLAERGGCHQRGDRAGTYCRCWSRPRWRARVPNIAVPWGAMGLQRLQWLHDGGTSACGLADPMRANHDSDGWHASARVWRDPARTGRGSGLRAGRRTGEDGARLWPTRDWEVPAWTEGVRGGRTTSSRLADGRGTVSGNTVEMRSTTANFPRGELWRWPPLGASSIGSQRSMQWATTPLGRERRRVFMLLYIHIYANVNRCLRHIFRSMATLPSIVCLWYFYSHFTQTFIDLYALSRYLTQCVYWVSNIYVSSVFTIKTKRFYTKKWRFLRSNMEMRPNSDPHANF
jgi:hypothetical protein